MTTDDRCRSADGRDLETDERRSLLGRGISVALSAGAGTGKTSVLVDQFVHELRGDPARIDRVVALTFTDKAAAEMRGRIRDRCRAEAAAGIGDPARWRAVVRGLERARVGTFHSFCIDSLRRFAVEVGLPPGFAVLDEGLAPTLRAEALAATLRRALGTDPPDADLVALAVEEGLDAVRETLAELIGRGPSPDDLERWGRAEAGELVEAWRSRWAAEGAPAVVASLVEQSRACLGLLSKYPCANPVGRRRWATLRDGFDLLARGAWGRSGPGPLIDSLHEEAKVQGAGTAKDWPSHEIYEDIKQSLAQLRKAMKESAENLAWDDRDEAASLAAADRGLRYARLAGSVLSRYRRMKEAEEALDFDDLLRAADRLLRGPAGPDDPAGALAREAAAVLVDEFQDTDGVQDAILRRLGGADPGAGRLFVVGDAKQSIYRFRGARPGVFEALRAEVTASGRLVQSASRRSVPGIVAFVNALFCEAIKNYEPLEARRPAPPGANGPAVTFLWAEAEDHTAEKLAAGDKRRAEARLLASHLAKRLSGGWTVVERSTGEARAAGPGDVMILLRTLADAGLYEEALAAEGLDYYTAGGFAFYAQQEVLDLANLLAAVEDPHDGLALAGALRGPAFGMSDDALFWLAGAGAAPGPSGGDLASGLAMAARGEGPRLPIADRRRARRAAELLSRWRAGKDREPVAGLVGRVLDESGFEAAVVAEPIGARRRANLRKLVDLARRHDARGLALADFVARLKADLRRPPREDQAASSDEGAPAVQIRTIHQAKGLERPIVVVADLDRRPRWDRDRVVFDPDLGPLCRPPEDEGSFGKPGPRSLGWATYTAREDQQERAEALRLFYVATTRARDWLILSAAIAPGPGFRASAPAMDLLAGRYDLATGAFLGDREPDAGPSPTVAVIAGPPPAATRSAAPMSGPDPRRRLAASILVGSRATPRASPRHPGEVGPTRPRAIDLGPSTGGSEGCRRVALSRSMALEPAAVDPDVRREVADRVGRRLVPAAPSRLIAPALARASGWLESAAGRSLADAPVAWRELRWSLAWPPGSADSTVFHGTMDAAWVDPSSGRACVAVLVGDDEGPEAGWLRLAMSARVASGLIGQAIEEWWWAGLVEGGAAEWVGPIDDVELDRAIAGWHGRGTAGPG